MTHGFISASSHEDQSPITLGTFFLPTHELPFTSQEKACGKEPHQNNQDDRSDDIPF